jgi:hypothetical protein
MVMPEGAESVDDGEEEEAVVVPPATVMLAREISFCGVSFRMPGFSETVPVFVMIVPGAPVTVAVIVSVADFPFGIVPIVQIPVELA